MSHILSIGLPSTLGSYLKLATLVFGADSPAITYLNEQIEQSPHGQSEEVLADESQMVYVLMHIHTNGYKK